MLTTVRRGTHSCPQRRHLSAGTVMRFMRKGLRLVAIDEALEIGHLEVVQNAELKRWLDRANLVQSGVEEPELVFVAHNGQLVDHIGES